MIWFYTHLAIFGVQTAKLSEATMNQVEKGQTVLINHYFNVHLQIFSRIVGGCSSSPFETGNVAMRNGPPVVAAPGKLFQF